MVRWFTDRMGRLEEIHSRHVISKWPSPAQPSKLGLVLALAVAIAATVMSAQVRIAQYDTWHGDPSLASSDSAFLFSTTDAPYFLRLGGALKRGESNAEFESLLAYPDNKRLAEQTPEAFNTTALPLLSRLIALLSPTDRPADLLRAGNQLVIACAAVTAILIVLTFAATGHGLPGAVAAAGSGLSSAYLVRSAAGRIDTDMLNLGLLYITFGAAIMAGRASTARSTLLWCIGAGGLARLFLAWYDRPQLIWLALAALIWLLAVCRKGPLVLAGGTVLFIAVSGMGFFNPFASGYLTDTLDMSAFTLPNTLSTITEAANISLAATILQATSSLEIGLVCLVGLAFWAVRHPVMAVAMSPLLGLALLNFIIGNRFIFYATPMLWFGLGYFLTILASYIQQSIFSTHPASWRQAILQAGAAVLGLMVVWTNTPTKYVPRPTFSKEVLAGFAAINGQYDAESTAVATWWDYGYASTFLNNLPVLHYGGAVNTATTHFVARALLDRDQTASVGTLKFLAREGSSGIRSFDRLQDLEAAFAEAGNLPSPDIMLVVTRQMAGWMGSISRIGNWDVETGAPIHPRGNNTGPQLNYEGLNCRSAGRMRGTGSCYAARCSGMTVTWRCRSCRPATGSQPTCCTASCSKAASTSCTTSGSSSIRRSALSMTTIRISASTSWTAVSEPLREAASCRSCQRLSWRYRTQI